MKKKIFQYFICLIIEYTIFSKRIKLLFIYNICYLTLVKQYITHILSTN